MPDIPHQYRKKAESTKGKEEKGLESYVVNMGFRNSGPPTKKRKIGPTSNAPEEIVFDEAARQDYLSGFHKRKQQRIKHAQNVAIQREKEEKIRDRAELRKQREQERENHVKAVNDAIKRFTHGKGSRAWEDSDASEEEDGAEEWNGVTEEVPEINREDEYIDEEKYTTVTVESVAVGKEGLITVDADEESDDEDGEADDTTQTTTETQQPNGRAPLPTQKKAWTKDKPKGEGVTKKKKKFRYERGESLKDVRHRQKERKKKREEGQGESKHRGPAKKQRRG